MLINYYSSAQNYAVAMLHPARYVRFYIWDNTATAARGVEFQVFDQSDINVALTATGSFATFRDDVFTTNRIVVVTGDGEKFDLGSVQDLKQIKLFARPYADNNVNGYTAQVDISSDNSNWTNIYNATSNWTDSGYDSGVSNVMYKTITL